MDTDNQNTSESKADLRSQIRARLEKISPAVRAVESIELCERLEAQLRSARTILFFAPLPDELDVWPLMEKFLAARKTCALPYFDSATKDTNVAAWVPNETALRKGSSISRCQFRLIVGFFNLFTLPGACIF